MKISFLIICIITRFALSQQNQSIDVEYTLKNGQLQRIDGKEIDIPQDLQKQLLDNLLELSQQNPDQEYAVSLSYESSTQQTQSQEPLQNQDKSQAEQKALVKGVQQKLENQTQQIDQRDIFDFRLEPDSTNGQAKAEVKTIYIPNSRNMTDAQIIMMVQQGSYQMVKDGKVIVNPNLKKSTASTDSLQSISYSYNKTTSSSDSSSTLNKNETDKKQLKDNLQQKINEPSGTFEIPGVDEVLQKLKDQPESLIKQKTLEAKEGKTKKKNFQFQNVSKEDQYDIDSIISDFLKQQTTFTSFQEQLDEKQKEISQKEEQQQEGQVETQQQSQQEAQDLEQKDGTFDLSQYQLDYQTVESKKPEDMIDTNQILSVVNQSGDQSDNQTSRFQTISPDQYEQLVVQSEQPISYDDFVQLPKNIDYRALVQLARSNDFPIPTLADQLNYKQLYFSCDFFKYKFFC